jgi:hypothetical protein
VIKLDAGVSWQGYLSVDNSSNSSVIATGRHGPSGQIASYTGGGANTQTAVAHSSADGWMLVANRRAAGTGSIPVLSKYPIGGSPTHTAGGAGQNNQTSQAGGRVVFGQINGSDFFKGRLAVAAIWTTDLSDANLESLVTSFTRANWLSLSPAGLWDELDAFSTDHTGNGASQTSLVGTTDDADDPSGWGSWGAGGGPTTHNASATIGATSSVSATGDNGEALPDTFVRVSGAWVAVDRVTRVGGAWV